MYLEYNNNFKFLLFFWEFFYYIADTSIEAKEKNLFPTSQHHKAFFFFHFNISMFSVVPLYPRFTSSFSTLKPPRIMSNVADLQVV